MAERRFRKYLAVFQLPRLTPEHAKTKVALEIHGGDLRFAFHLAGPKRDMATLIGYFFSLRQVSNEMGFPLLNGYKHFVVEVGNECWIEGNGQALQWFQKHAT